MATRSRTPGRRRPRKRFGQHFLAPAWAERVVEAIRPVRGDAFLEIGPGTGAITLPLAATGLPVLAIEIDRDLAGELAGKAPPNVTILTADVLKTDVMPLLSGLAPQGPPDPIGIALPERRLRVVGNLPYYATSPILFRLVDLHRAHGLLHDATVMVQKEVAERLVARPGTRDYGVLTVLLGVHARISRVLELPPGAFTPPPKVRSTLVHLELTAPAVRIPDERLFEKLVKAIFSQRRKTLLNSLKAFDKSAAAILERAEIDGRRRPETLSLDEIARLADLLAAGRRDRTS
jgi:16S rRNA (adenine1518-N6/adenine1519-N6)-dimethyltransferase